MKSIIVAGPTATGKTEVSIELAKRLNGELINADSRQVYKDLNIGTNKGDLVLKDEQYYIKSVPIHLINILDPKERFNLFDFQKLALNIIKEISDKGKLPIIVGGTGLYIDSLIKGYVLNEGNNDKRKELENLTTKQLQKLISEESLNQLNNSDKNNPRRLIRVIEKNENTEVENVDFNIQSQILYPEYDWEDLKLKIDKRVEDMFNQGLIEETKALIENGLSLESEAFKIMGYKEVIMFLNKEIDLNTCKERVKIAHKQYAKRQRTWFEGEGRDYKLNKFSSTDNALELAEKFISDEV